MTCVVLPTLVGSHVWADTRVVSLGAGVMVLITNLSQPNPFVVREVSISVRVMLHDVAEVRIVSLGLTVNNKLTVESHPAIDLNRTE